MPPKSTSISPSPQPRTADRLKRINILVVISSDKAASLIERLFNQLGFSEIFIARDATEAVQLLRDLKIHLLVTDSDLKVNTQATDAKDLAPTTGEDLHLSGIRFIERLRHAPASPAPFIPVLMLIDHAHHQEIIMARDAGVNEVVLKPMEARDFCERVIHIIDKPRVYITATNYKGPCRRRQGGPPPGTKERRVREVRVVRCSEQRGKP